MANKHQQSIEKLKQDFGQWVKTNRESAGLTQKELADKAGIHVVQISRIENGGSGTKQATVLAIAEALNASSREAMNAAGYDLPINRKEEKEFKNSDFGILFYEYNELNPDDQRDMQIAIDMLKAEIHRRRQKK